MKKQINYKKGQTTLITLLIFMVIAITVTSAATIMMIINSTSTSQLERSAIAYSAAEGGIENAVLRLLRNPNYTGETLTIGEGTTTIQVITITPNQKRITSSGKVGSFLRKIQVEISYNDNILEVTSWKETF